MQTEYPTTDITEFSFYAVFNIGPEYNSRPQYFHYTNLDNIGFILKDDHIDLRLTRADYLADTAEMRHIIPVVEDACTDLLQQGAIDREFCHRIKVCLSGSEPFIEEFRKYYVFCMSANGDATYLKENYACKGGKDGAIIGIQGLAFEDIQFAKDGEKEKPVFGINIYDVIYSGEKLKKDFCKIFMQLYEMNDGNAESREAIERVVKTMITYALVYKSSIFSKEEETRVVIDIARLTLPEEKYYQDDNRYLHILLPKNSLCEMKKIP